MLRPFCFGITIQRMVRLGIGDRVRIRSIPITNPSGFAGQLGQVMRYTTPSVTCVQVIGHLGSDHAIAVKLEGLSDVIWFDPDLLELIDHGAGTSARVGNRNFTRTGTGEWVENPEINQ
jgi:hypothetical protein